MASKIEKDRALYEKLNLSDPKDRITAVKLVAASYHDSGKIEGITSLDSSALSCEFCKTMRENAQHNSAIVCGDCYAAALARFRVNMEQRHRLNQDILSDTLFEIDELANIPFNTIYNRFNSDGDIENTIQARNYLRIAKANSNKHFALWFKNLPAVKAARELEGKPENVIFIYSSCMIGFSSERIMEMFPWIDYVFTVYPDHDSTNKAIAAGACECNGRKCFDCGYKCYNGSWPIHSNIAEYLRGIGKEKRKALVALCNKYSSSK